MTPYYDLVRLAGHWVIEASGSYDNFRKVIEKETDAKATLTEVATAVLKEHGEFLDIESDDIQDELETLLEDNEAQWGYDERFQCYRIYQIPSFKNRQQAILWQMEKAIEKGFDGVNEYAILLEDSDVARSGYYELQELLDELKKTL